ncbi:hypothetical protein F6V30_01315 [Oryzomonas sagensis]|uniref:Uncharacterized protein n=1 Tax=Oryzomonas sagensis TaxID=2603857 RepID=A0ABQ6TQH0_9BACT|nr:hypothetical protein [Oryzomonas sagensis]KAB0671255.1 hypothetical protein F6V30_01315 [Oryzomonas sagensis]
MANGSSVDKMGGGESCLEVTEEVQSGGESLPAYIPARIVVNENGEIVIPANSGFSLLSRVAPNPRLWCPGRQET